MLAMSARFQDAIVRSGSMLARSCTITPPGGTAVPFGIDDGSVTEDSTSQARGGANFTVPNIGGAMFDLFSTPGALVRIRAGFQFDDGSTETVPMFTGYVTGTPEDAGAGSVAVSCQDRWWDASRKRSATPLTVQGNVRNSDVIAATLSALYPGITVHNVATSTVSCEFQTWPASRTDMVADLAKDAALEVFFDRNGDLVIRDAPKDVPAVVWTLSTGNGGTVKALPRDRDLDGLYNTVVVRPLNPDGSQITWPDDTTAQAGQAQVQITNPADPLYPGKVGVLPIFWGSSTAGSYDDLVNAGKAMLQKVAGFTETIGAQALACWGLEAEDAVRVVSAAGIGDLPAVDVVHVVESLSFDLASGDMTANTRTRLSANDVQEVTPE